MHAADNNMPCVADIARQMTRRDEPDPNASTRPRVHVRSGTRSEGEKLVVGRVAVGKEPSAWDSWGGQDVSATVPSLEQRQPSTRPPSRRRSRRGSESIPELYSEGTNGWAGNRASMSTTALTTQASPSLAQVTVTGWGDTGQHEAPSSAFSRSAEPKYSEEDGWASYVPAQALNDAYERRAALSQAEPAAIPTVHRGQSVAQAGHTTASTAPEAATRLPAAAAEDDGWSNWKASSTDNDAFERRARMGRQQGTGGTSAIHQSRTRSPPMANGHGSQQNQDHEQHWSTLSASMPRVVWAKETVEGMTRHTDSSSANTSADALTLPTLSGGDDGWSNWQASTTVNDAHERRSRLRPGDSARPLAINQVAPPQADSGEWGDKSAAPTLDVVYSSSVHRASDHLSRMSLSSTSSSMSRRPILPELERKKPISIKGNFERLVEETSRREAAGEKSRQLEHMRKRVQAVEAVNAKVSSRVSAAFARAGTASPAHTTLSTHSIAEAASKMHAPQPVRPAQVWNGWDTASINGDSGVDHERSMTPRAGSIGWE